MLSIFNLSYRFCFEMSNNKGAYLRINFWNKLAILEVKKSKCYGNIISLHTNWSIIYYILLQIYCTGCLKEIVDWSFLSWLKIWALVFNVVWLAWKVTCFFRFLDFKCFEKYILAALWKKLIVNFSECEY